MSRWNPCGNQTCDECYGSATRLGIKLDSFAHHVRLTTQAVAQFERMLCIRLHRPRPLPIDGRAYRRRARRRKR